MMHMPINSVELDFEEFIFKLQGALRKHLSYK